MIVEWINFSSLIISTLLLSIFYIISIQPIKRLKKRGENVWKESEIIKIISGIFEFIILINAIIWIWYPLPFLGWKVEPNYFISLIIALAIAIPYVIIMIKGIRDAASDTLKPSKDTEMLEGFTNTFAILKALENSQPL